MGHVGLDIDGAVYSTDALLSDYIELQVGKRVTIEVRSGSQTTHAAIMDVINAAGPAAYGVDLDGDGWYIDRVRDGADATSALVGVEPVNLPEMEGIWGIVVDGEDQTRIPGAQRNPQMSLFVLSRFSGVSRTDLQTKSEVSVP